jgi:hypothetical protein
MLGFEPIACEPICSHYTSSGLFAGLLGALRVRLRAIGPRLRVTVFRFGPRG